MVVTAKELSAVDRREILNLANGVVSKGEDVVRDVQALLHSMDLNALGQTR